LKDEIKSLCDITYDFYIFNYCHDRDDYLLLTDIKFLHPVDKLKIRKCLDLFIKHQDETVSLQFFSQSSFSVNDLRTQIQTKTAATDIQIEYFDIHLHEYSALESLRDLGPRRIKLRVTSTKNSMTLIQALDANEKLRSELNNERVELALARKLIAELQAQSEKKSQDFEKISQELEKFKSEDIFEQGLQLKSRCWSPFLDRNIDWNKETGKFCAKATIPDLEAEVINYFRETVQGQDLNVTRIEFIQNFCLQKKFEATLHIMSKQGHENEESCAMAERFKPTPEKEAVLKRFSDRYQRVSPNDKIKVVLTWVGISTTNVEIVCDTGLSDLRIKDKGFFGAGIYSTLQANYAMMYAEGQTTKDVVPANTNGEHCLLLCWVAVGNVYPISRDIDYERGDHFSRFFHLRNGLALSPGFDSHCACVYADKKHYQAARFDSDKDSFPQDPKDLVDEIVVKESSQILPYCIVYYKK